MTTADAQQLLQQGRVPEALAAWRAAARAGDAQAQFEAGRALLLLAQGEAVEREAVHWLECAERANHAGASTWLAQIALGGVFVARELGLIGTRLYRASQAGEAGAMRAVALGLGRNAAPAAQREATRLFGQAAGGGDSVAALLLAARCRLGLGMPRDSAQAQSIEAQLARSQIAPLPFVLPDEAPDAGADPDPRLSLTRLLTAPPATRLSERPDVRHVRALLSAEECRYLIAMARPRMRRSQVFSRDADRIDHSQARSSSEASFAPQHEDFALRLLQLRMARAAGCELVQAEPLVVLHYGAGDEYRPHRDYLPPSALAERQPQAGQRRTTICVYLSPVEKGGETVFPVADLSIAPQPGDAVIFENLRPDGQPDPDSLHAGAAIEAGEKWLATLWLRQGRYRRF